MMTEAKMSVADWREKEFLPWKAAMAKYMDERSQQLARLKVHAAELQSIVAMLAEGRSRQAMLAWNTLQLQPKLKEIRVSGDGESLTLVAADGGLTLLKLDDVVAELGQLLKG